MGAPGTTLNYIVDALANVLLFPVYLVHQVVLYGSWTPGTEDDKLSYTPCIPNRSCTPGNVLSGGGYTRFCTSMCWIHRVLMRHVLDTQGNINFLYTMCLAIVCLVHKVLNCILLSGSAKCVRHPVHSSHGATREILPYTGKPPLTNQAPLLLLLFKPILCLPRTSCWQRHLFGFTRVAVGKTGAHSQN